MTTKDIKFLRVTPLRGPNIWTYRPVIEAWVDIGDLEDSPSNTLPGFIERLVSWLPSLVEHRCSVGKRGGFLERLREGTWPAHIMEHVAIELQNLAGLQTGFGKARQTSVRGVYKVAVRARNAEVGRAAVEAARDLVMAAIDNRPFDVPATVARLKEMVDSRHLGPSTSAIVDAATKRRIPWLRLNDGNLVQFGYGARQRRIWTAETDRTSAIAESISRDKDLTKRLLAACGVPIPEGRIVASAEDAWEAAQAIGLPVVVKPVDANHGRGVSLDLTTREDVEAAFHVALREGSEVMVERFVRGNEHRLLVVGDRVVAAAKGEEAWVTGDGRSTIAELIDAQLNTDPRRGTTEDFPLNKILLNEDPAVVLELERQGFEPASVPAAGQAVLIQRNGNVAFDVTDEMHPEVAAAACLAARVVGLDIAGVDLVAKDIARPLEEQGGAIVEVNAGPGLLMHLKPAAGKPRPVGQAIVDHLFPPGDDGRIPIVGVTGRDGACLVAHLIAWGVHLSGSRVGLACSDGLYLDRRRIEKGNCATWEAGERLLMNRTVEAVVLENGAETILSQGLAYDRCRVGVVTGVGGEDRLGEYYIHDAEQVFNVLRTQVDVVLPNGAAVLNADDPLAARMAPLCDGEVIFFSLDEASPVVARHRAQGGRAVLACGARIVLAAGQEDTSLVRLAVCPWIRAAGLPAPLPAALAAIGALWALDVAADVIAAGLETFEPDQTGALGAGMSNQKT
ncbi:MAG: cyanophycin synthetase [Pseudomonadota bacterium]|jgi:cyanophycin synthetase